MTLSIKKNLREFYIFAQFIKKLLISGAAIKKKACAVTSPHAL